MSSGLDEELSVINESGAQETITWTYPSKGDCVSCHNSVSKGTLGPRTRYLNTDYTYPSTGISANQLVTLSHLGILDQSISDSDTPDYLTYKSGDDPMATLDEKARSYMDLNCAYCHRPGTGNRAQFDLRLINTLEETQLLTVGVLETLGIAGEEIVKAGDASKSIVYHRMNDTGSFSMPPLAKNQIDDKGVSLIKEWINQLNIDPADNVALNKSASQSSTGNGGSANRAVDGNRGGVYNDNSVTHTISGSDPWWRVDLGAKYDLTHLRIYNRTDCCSARLDGAKVYVGNVDSNDPNDYLEVATLGSDYEQLVSGVTANGRYIMVALTGEDRILSLAELEAYGSLSPVSVTGVTLDRTSVTLDKGDTTTLVARVSPSDATDPSVNWSSDDGAVATVDANGLVTAVSAGTATITVTTTEGDFTASSTVTVNVPVTGVALDRTSVSLTEGDTTTLVATVSPSDATDASVGWSSDDVAVATVDANGLVTAVSAGTATITVTTTDGDLTASSTVTVDIAVVPVTGVALDRTSVSLTEGDTTTLVATVSPSDATDASVNWSSDDVAVATVDANGLVTAVSSGTATITAATVDGGLTASSTVTVSGTVADCGASGTILMERYDGIPGNTIADLEASASYPDSPDLVRELGEFRIPQNASDNYGARISGYICAPETGTYYFWITGDNYSDLYLSPGEDASQRVRIAYVEGYTSHDGWNRYASQSSSGVELEKGRRYYVEALFKEGVGGDHMSVGWRRPGDGTGDVPSEVVPGSVLSPREDAPQYVAVTGVSVSPPSVGLDAGATTALTATVSPSDATDASVNWSSDDVAVATVDANGLVTAVSSGTATITAATVDGGLTASSTVTVSGTVADCGASGTILMERYDGIPGNTIADLEASASYPDSPDLVRELGEFRIPQNASDNYGARISGYICAPETGTYYFWITGDNYSDLYLSPGEDASQRVRIAYVEGYTSHDGWNRYASQSSSGVELEKGRRYYVEALFKEGVGGDHMSVGWRRPGDGTGDVPSEVVPGSVLSPREDAPQYVAVTGVSVSPPSVGLDAGATTALTATVSPSDATDASVNWSSDDVAVATVDANGLVTAVSSGTATITAATVDGGLTASSTVTVSGTVADCGASGTILMERYDGIPGNTIADLEASASYPDSPDLVRELGEFRIPQNASDNYGARISGYICAPETGTYYFWITGDNYSDLYLSPGEDASQRVRIAYVEGYTSHDGWNRYASQSSSGVELEKGRRYYVEALFKEGVGGDHMSVGWRRPGDSTGDVPSEVVPGSVLSPRESVVTAGLRAAGIYGDGSETVTVESDIAIVPNPTYGIFAVYLGNLMDTSGMLAIYDSAGRHIMGFTIPENHSEFFPVDANSLPDGVYNVVILTSNGERFVKPVVIE